MTNVQKFLSMGLAVGLFVAVVGIVLFIANRFNGNKGDRGVAFIFLLPTLLLLAVGLVYPGLRTIFYSFFDAAGSTFIGVDNYHTIVTSSDQLVVLRNTLLWVVVTPFVATLIGLVYAIIVDGARMEAAAKALIFLPMAISLVGASIIWKFVYAFRPDQPGVQQIGLLNQVIVWLGGTPQNWLLNSPLNTVFLIVVMIWVQAGFAMTILSAAIKAIPDEIVEAASSSATTTAPPAGPNTSVV